MRLKYHRFEDLVTENRRELLEDDKLMQRLEMRLENKRTEEPKKHTPKERRIFQ